MILIVGSGVAGLSCALAAASAGAEVLLATPGRLAPADDLAGGSTALAQGGIAAAIAPGDTPDAHLADTIAAGAGLVDREAAEVLVREGARAVQKLIDEGFAVDRDEHGAIRFGLEAAHGANRIVHAGGDRTGAVLHAHLVERVLREPLITVTEGLVVESLVTDSGSVMGAVLRDDAGSLQIISADAVVLATGGYAALYPRSTNPSSSQGEGIVLAARAGALIADLEFVQFHPTVLKGSGTLISEAVRGAGAVLRDGSGHRFMADRHPLAELAPRDVVSWEIQYLLDATGEEEVWLDATVIERAEGPGTLARRFPGISAALAAHGYDWTREPIPVVPASHYTMGGVASDLDGRSSLPGLFVAGEVASTGVHGANRLASNSLLEGLVFGERAAAAAINYASDGGWELNGVGMRGLVADRSHAAVEASPAHDLEFAAVTTEADRQALFAMIRIAATARTESRGAHRRTDFPNTDPAQAHRRAYVYTFPRADQTGAELEPRSLASC